MAERQVQPPADAPFTGSFYVSLVGNDLYLNYAAVPEPGSLLLMGIAGLGFGGMGWKKRRRKSADEAADWMVTAARHRPVSIAPRIAVTAHAINSIAPAAVDAIMKRQRMQPRDA